MKFVDTWGETTGKTPSQVVREVIDLVAWLVARDELGKLLTRYYKDRGAQQRKGGADAAGK